jgi:hypothetical protein
MHKYRFRAAMYLICVGALAGCSGADGVDGATGSPGTSCTVSEVDGVATITCTDGTSAQVLPGRNGTDGSDGFHAINMLLNVVPEEPGANCPAGGTRIDYGYDHNLDGALGSGEVTGTMFICNGEDGQDGQDGQDGRDGEDALRLQVSVSLEPPGPNCANGGQRIVLGYDTVGDGAIDLVSSDSYVCNGVDGQDGLTPLIEITDEAPGAQCPNGGKQLTIGYDTNGDAMIDVVSRITFVCNGVDGTDGQNGLISVVTEPPGVNCTFGGHRVQVGLDTNGDGTLQPSEVESTFFVCAPLSCDPATDVSHNGRCYYLDGSGGVCLPGYTLAPESILSTIAADFVGKTYKTQPSDACCVWHRDQDTDRQNWGFSGIDCNGSGPFSTPPVPGGSGCSNVLLGTFRQLTLCQTTP